RPLVPRHALGPWTFHRRSAVRPSRSPRRRGAYENRLQPGVMLVVGCGLLVVGCWLDVGCWMLDVGCWMLDVGCWMLDVGPLFPSACRPRSPPRTWNHESNKLRG